MTTEIRTFDIPDAEREPAQNFLSNFLRTVEVQRIDTAYADGAWRVLVLYQDLRRKEESAQIESAIVGALGSWRNRVAKRDGVSPESILPEDLLPEIARFAPTTERELSVIVGAAGFDPSGHGAEIVGIVRSTLEDLVD